MCTGADLASSPRRGAGFPCGGAGPLWARVGWGVFYTPLDGVCTPCTSTGDPLLIDALHTSRKTSRHDLLQIATDVVSLPIPSFSPRVRDDSFPLVPGFQTTTWLQNSE